MTTIKRWHDGDEGEDKDEGENEDKYDEDQAQSVQVRVPLHCKVLMEVTPL